MEKAMKEALELSKMSAQDELEQCGIGDPPQV